RQKHSPVELPVLLLTARNRISDLVAGFDAGANDYLTKPCSREELIARVQGQLQIRWAHQLEKENQRLRFVVEQERHLQQGFWKAQEQLEKILGPIGLPVLVTDDQGTVLFCNAAMIQILGKDIASLVGQEAKTLTGEDWSALGRKSSSFEGHVAGQKHAVFFYAVETSEDRLCVYSIGSALVPGMLSSWETESGPTPSAKELVNLAQKSMRLAMDCWEKYTGLSKNEFARQSGLWTVYVNLDGWERTRTLDRYLSMSEFPQNPRIKKVYATLAFVLERLPSFSQERTQLLELMEKLQIKL
ncbi:MAG TPA: response regulator, partial [Fibrobacteraceae bacterium]|nr:response regulator [Fibrobacteraceae bacterium]